MRSPAVLRGSRFRRRSTRASTGTAPRPCWCRPSKAARSASRTRYEVTIDRGASSAAGRSLAAPYTFSFTTPTPRVLSAQVYRKTRRYDSPAVIALRFNQPMRAADVVAHTRIAHQPHSGRRRCSPAQAGRDSPPPTRPGSRDSTGRSPRWRASSRQPNRSRSPARDMGRGALSAIVGPGRARDHRGSATGSLAASDARRTFAGRAGRRDARGATDDGADGARVLRPGPIMRVVVRSVRLQRHPCRGSLMLEAAIKALSIRDITGNASRQSHAIRHRRAAEVQRTQVGHQRRGGWFRAPARGALVAVAHGRQPRVHGRPDTRLSLDGDDPRRRTSGRR